MLKKTTSLITIIFASALSACAIDINDFIKPANPLEQQTPAVEVVEPSAPKKTGLTKNDIHNQYAIALNRYIQSNVKSSYRDFSILIENITPSDYVYMHMANEMANLGFFDLSELALSKIEDDNISYLLAEDIKNFYYPSSKLSKEDEIYLAEMYSNIIYNEQSREVIAELTKNETLLNKYDYTNYIVAMGYFKLNDLENADKYINTAISKNHNNLNYKKLKTEILSQAGKAKEARKLADSIKSQSMLTTIFSNKIKSMEEYTLYKTNKNEFEQKYHLAYYFYLEGELNKSMRTLQTAFNTKKSHNKKVYALLSKVYFDSQEYEKVEDNATKATKIDKSNNLALIVLGDLAYKNKDYKTASKYYQSARGNEADIKLAKCYMMLDKTDKAKEILAKILKNNSNECEAYYNMALLDKSREVTYLKKSVAINYMFKDGWIDLARCEIEQNRYDNANVYLSNARYIDENDYRYYYYHGLIYKNKGLTADAKRSFMKSVKLNPDFLPAKEELSI